MDRILKQSVGKPLPLGLSARAYLQLDVDHGWSLFQVEELGTNRKRFLPKETELQFANPLAVRTKLP